MCERTPQHRLTLKGSQCLALHSATIILCTQGAYSQANPMGTPALEENEQTYQSTDI